MSSHHTQVLFNLHKIIYIKYFSSLQIFLNIIFYLRVADAGKLCIGLAEARWIALVNAEISFTIQLVRCSLECFHQQSQIQIEALSDSVNIYDHQITITEALSVHFYL